MQTYGDLFTSTLNPAQALSYIFLSCSLASIICMSGSLLHSNGERWEPERFIAPMLSDFSKTQYLIYVTSISHSEPFTIVGFKKECVVCWILTLWTVWLSPEPERLLSVWQVEKIAKLRHFSLLNNHFVSFDLPLRSYWQSRFFFFFFCQAMKTQHINMYPCVPWK